MYLEGLLQLHKDFTKVLQLPLKTACSSYELSVLQEIGLDLTFILEWVKYSTHYCSQN